MLDVEERRAAVVAAENSGDPERLDQARQAYLEADGGGAYAADVRYRLGLSRLFRHQDTDGAIELFKAAAGEKSAPIAPEARISLALCLSAKAKRQQAIFELRKLLPEGVVPSIHTAQALDFLSMLLRDSGAPQKDLIAVDEQRKSHLRILAGAASDPLEMAQWLLRLAAAWQEGGTPMDLQQAKKVYDDVIKLGPAAGDSAVTAARFAHKNLPR